MTDWLSCPPVGSAIQRHSRLQLEQISKLYHQDSRRVSRLLPMSSGCPRPPVSASGLRTGWGCGEVTGEGGRPRRIAYRRCGWQSTSAHVLVSRFYAGRGRGLGGADRVGAEGVGAEGERSGGGGSGGGTRMRQLVSAGDAETGELGSEDAGW